MRKFLVQLEGSQEEAKAESPQQLAELYQGMGIDDFKILRDLGPVQQQVVNNDTLTPLDLVNSDGSRVSMMSLEDIPEEYRPKDVKQINNDRQSQEFVPNEVQNIPTPVQEQSSEKIWKDGNQEFMLKNGELHKRCWRKTTLKELEKKLGCKIKITDSKNIQVQDWEKLGD